MTTHTNRLLQRGFTLVELLVSMTITIIIIGLLVFVTRTAFDTLSEGTGDISSYRKGEQVIQQLAQDLETMVYRSDNNYTWLVADASHATADAGSGFSGYSSDLAFFTVAADRYDGNVTVDGNNGDIACVRYGVAFTNPMGGEDSRRMMLYRQVIDPKDAFANLLGQDMTDSAFLNAIETIEPLNDVSNIMSDNIRELSVSFTVQTAAGIEKIDVVNNGSANANSLTLKGNGVMIGGAAVDAEVRILSIDINAQILSEESLGFLNLKNVPTEKLERGIKRFSKTIYVPQI